uniref:Phospholipase B1, membrane-associated-like n=1 Tax=Haemonchus contortus TaxID=6289 RepID=W6NDI3_HAECO
MFPFILLFIVHFCRSNPRSEDVKRIEEKLTTDREFYDQWMQLISLQADQLEEQTLDYPLAVTALGSCTRIPPSDTEDTSDTLRPTSISIYADIGHLATYCKSNYSELQAGILDSCDHRSSSTDLPSLDKMFKVFNPDLIIVESNERDDSLREQARTIAESIQQFKGYENVWKFILIAATIQDGEASESRQTAVEVLEAVEELHRQLPVRTFITIIRTSGNGIWSDATHSHVACRELLSMWKTHSKYNSMSVWDQMEAIIHKNFRRSDFTVEVLPLLRDSALTNLPEQMDLSILGYDCAHFSERGLSLLHIAIWNSLFTKSGDRLRDYRPIAPPLMCPDFRCPYLRTATNSGFCIWKAPLVAEETSIYPKLITACVLVFCLLLAVAVLFFMCRKPRRTIDIKKPAHPFGASLSSIKFIDEDT